jgi:ribokinase
MFDVICVGTATIDVFARTKYSELIKISDPKGEQSLLAYPTGSKILIEEMNFTTGGGGTNVAAALSMLGLKVAYLGCMGKDSNSDFVIKDLNRFKINTDLIVRKEGQTGYSIILDSIEHDRTILTYRGLNNDMDFKDIAKNKLRTRWFYFSAMMDRSFNAQVQLAKYAEKNNIKIIYNISSYLAEKGRIFLKEILCRTEILVLNKEEAELIVGKDKIAQMAIDLNRLGPKYVVITDGKNGAYCYNDGFFYFAPTSDIKVVETTGAGDAFASTFLYGMLKKKDISIAMQLATTNSESVISHHGAKTKLLSEREALAILKKRPIRIVKSKFS